MAVQYSMESEVNKEMKGSMTESAASAQHVA